MLQINSIMKRTFSGTSRFRFVWDDTSSLVYLSQTFKTKTPIYSNGRARQWYPLAIHHLIPFYDEQSGKTAQ